MIRFGDISEKVLGNGHHNWVYTVKHETWKYKGASDIDTLHRHQSKWTYGLGLFEYLKQPESNKAGPVIFLNIS